LEPRSPFVIDDPIQGAHHPANLVVTKSATQFGDKK
jgi:hypothetical protein